MSWLRAMTEKEPPEPEHPLGTVVIGSLMPDLHEAAYQTVRKALKKAQFKTVDVGKGAPPELFVSKAKETKADIIAVSMNTLPAKANLPRLVELMEKEGLKEKVILLMGGAAVAKDDADKAGGFYGKTKEEGVVIARRQMDARKTK